MLKNMIRGAATLGLLGGLGAVTNSAQAGLGYYYEAPSYYVAPPVYTYSPPHYSSYGFSTYPRYGYGGGYVRSRYYGAYSPYADPFGGPSLGIGIHRGHPYGGYGTGFRPYSSRYRDSYGGRFR